MDRILIILFDDYCKISKSDRVKVYNFLKPELQSIISNNKNIMPSNYLLRCFYKYIISDTNYKYKADRLIFSYSIIRKTLPKFFLNYLRSKNLMV